MNARRSLAKTLASWAGWLGLLLATSSGARAQSPYNGWITGYVTASQVGAGSITPWMKKLKCDTEADCIQKLVAGGGKYVLVIFRNVYQLSDQKRPAPHAGMDVMVKGVLNYQTKIITVEDVQDIGICD